MTFGEKLSKLRKEENYTQEQLADILEVSRQSVSKWESDIAYPETEKLVKIAKLFNCSVDYLLKDECTDPSGKEKSDFGDFVKSIGKTVKKQFHERKSDKIVCGMPLYHIGRDARGIIAIGIKAKGFIAIGFDARGLISVGMLSIGLLSFGLLSLGLIALGIFACGLMVVGSIALGVFAVGAIALGFLTFGALSVGQLSVGALSIGNYFAYGDCARGMIAIGKSDAVGDVYTHICEFGNLGREEAIRVCDLLDKHVPWYLDWAKEIIKIFIK